MRGWRLIRSELREVAWLVSIIGALSVLGVGLAIALALTLEAHAEPLASKLSAEISINSGP